MADILTHVCLCMQAMVSLLGSSRLCTFSAAMTHGIERLSRLQVGCVLAAWASCLEPDAAGICLLIAGCIATLVPAESAAMLASGSSAPQGCAATVVDERTTAYLYIKGALDPAKELAKLSSQQASPLLSLSALALPFKC